MKKILGVILAALFVGLAVFYFLKTQDDVSPERSGHETVPSEFQMNESQKKNFKPIPESLLISRVKINGIWQVIIGEETSDFQIGRISIRKDPQHDLPLYLCEYSLGENKKSLSLDLYPHCNGGTPRSPTPIGYSSRILREGHLLVTRCRSKTGFYLSLNSRCESPNDGANEVLGSFEAVKN